MLLSPEALETGLIAKPEMKYPVTILSDRGLEHALATGKIRISPLEKKQVQPSSIDLSICSAAVYDEEVRVKAALQGRLVIDERHLEDSLEDLAKYFQGDDVPFDLSPNSYAEITLLEKVDFDPEEYSISLELRSSRGRPGILPFRLPLNISSRNYVVSVINRNPNTLRLYTGTPFLQLFFHPLKSQGNGHLVTDQEEARSIAEKCCEGHFDLLGSYIVFRLTDSVLKFKKDLGVIDTKQKYPDDYLYHKVDLPSRLSVSDVIRLMPHDAIIAPLNPRLNLPADVGIRLISRIPYSEQAHRDFLELTGFRADNYQVNAGWVDPGYKGNVTAHPTRSFNPLSLTRGKPIALGIFYRYSRPVLRPYGSEKLGTSHYQNSDGAGHRS
jgi:deoxycytidine triphosphate deaminase